MATQSENLSNFANALAAGDENNDGLLNTDEITAAMAGMGGDISVDVVRGERASGSTSKVLENVGHFQHGTDHIDGASENHGSGELAPPVQGTSKPKSSGGETRFQKQKNAKERVKEIMRMFDSDNNGVLNAKEQAEMFKAILKALECERKKEMAARNYDAGTAIRDQIANIRLQIKKLDLENEERRQAEQKAMFQKAMSARNDTMKKTMADKMDKTEKNINQRVKLWNQRTGLETMMLEKELSSWPQPPARYSKGLIEMRHAEMALASDQRYEEAQNVRATTQVREAKEMAQLLAEWECKRDTMRHNMEKDHIDSAMRLEEKVKDMRWRAKRGNQDFRKRDMLCRKNHTNDMRHMLTMEKHKVVGTAHNVALPPARKPCPETNASCRGTRLNDMYIGKRHLAIPSLSGVHDFKHGDSVKMGETDKRHKRGLATTRVL